MIERRIALEKEGGTLDARLYLPSAGGPWPLVVFYMDAFGLRPSLTAMAARLGDGGYAVVQPNLFWRSGPFAPFDPAKTFTDPKERERVMSLMNAVRVEDVVSDTRALLEEVGSDPRVSTARLGLVGYCMGGRFAFLVAAELGERVAASASIHPGGLVTENSSSPHLRSASIRGRVYLGIADEDRSCSPQHQQALREALSAAGVRHTLELYSGAHHGFAVPDHSVYDAVAAERHWTRVLELFDSELRR